MTTVHCHECGRTVALESSRSRCLCGACLPSSREYRLWRAERIIMARRRRKGIACRLARWASDQVAAWLEGPSRIEWR